MVKKLEGDTLALSVRDLVEFLLRSGDIDRRISAEARNDAMLAGSRIHRKIQKSRGADYAAEVPLSFTAKAGEYTVVCEGRADGIFTRDGVITVEEIKGVYRDIARMEEPVPVHLAQALCYACFLAEERSLDSVGIRMTYCHLESGEMRSFDLVRTHTELAGWYGGLMEELAPWIALAEREIRERDRSLRALAFPFPWRKGQREMASAVYRTIRDGRRIFVQAPTGIGKTLSTVFPAVKAVGEGLADRVFYLTAKSTTNLAAEEAFRILRDRGLYFRTVTLAAREKLCPFPDAECNPEACARAKGHFDRVNRAIFSILSEEGAYGREALLRFGERFQVCPYELALDLAGFADGIIGDYNYAFDPEAKLSRFFATGKPGGKPVLLIDEAHNLAGRAREMYSAEIRKNELGPVERTIAALRRKGHRKSGTEKRIEALRDALLELRKTVLLREETASVGEHPLFPGEGGVPGPGKANDPAPGGTAIPREAVGRVTGAAGLLSLSLGEFLDDHREFSGRDEVLEFSFRLRKFADTAELLDESYRILAVCSEHADIRLRLFCVNPSTRLAESLSLAAGAVFFSATLLPLGYYRELLSGDGENYGIRIPSPFPRENRKIFIAGDVTSSYRSRGDQEYRKIAAYIRVMAGARRGNYLVFFPSYAFMDKVAGIFREEGADFDLQIQENTMDMQARERFLAEFTGNRERTLVGMGVLGGIFSEGIDLAENRLIGACVVGTGLMAPDAEQRLLREYFDGQGKDGFRCAFQIPGMTRVMQAAGRVIRTPRDLGVILLLDRRFLRDSEKSLFPEEWSDAESVSLTDFPGKIREFWDGAGET